MDAGRDDDIAAAEACDLDAIIAKILDSHVFRDKVLSSPTTQTWGVSPV